VVVSDRDILIPPAVLAAFIAALVGYDQRDLGLALFLFMQMYFMFVAAVLSHERAELQRRIEELEKRRD
jgi:cell division protein FtsW (lipid II flippase)